MKALEAAFSSPRVSRAAVELLAVEPEPALSTQEIGRLAREDLERHSTVEDLQAAIAELRAKRAPIMEKRNRALLPRADDPTKALNREAAHEHELELAALDEDIARHEGALEAARQADKEHRRQELEHDHAERLAKLIALADKRLDAAGKLDAAAEAFVRAYRVLLDATRDVEVAMLRHDSHHPDTSNAGQARTLNAIRERLRDLGVKWAAPEPLVFRPSSPTLAEQVRGMNEGVLASQPRTIEG